MRTPQGNGTGSICVYTYVYIYIVLISPPIIIFLTHTHTLTHALTNTTHTQVLAVSTCSCLELSVKDVFDAFDGNRAVLKSVLLLMDGPAKAQTDAGSSVVQRASSPGDPRRGSSPGASRPAQTSGAIAARAHSGSCSDLSRHLSADDVGSVQASPLGTPSSRAPPPGAGLRAHSASLSDVYSDTARQSAYFLESSQGRPQGQPQRRMITVRDLKSRGGDKSRHTQL